MAVGDTAGTLHILEIPWSLRTPTANEFQSMTNYFEREVKRRAFVVARWDFREREKRDLESETKKKLGVSFHFLTVNKISSLNLFIFITI